MAARNGEPFQDRQLTTISVRADEEVPGLVIVKYTRPERLNSFIEDQYEELRDTFNELNEDPRVSVILWTGSGKFFSSGQDLGATSKEAMAVMGDKEKMREFYARKTKQHAGAVVEALINLKKPIIAACNGPAVGFGCTTLALCDVVYASNSAWFHTPFMQFAFCPEGCSSLLFPEIMGTSLANEVLLLGRKLTAGEALRCGFVSQVFSEVFFAEEVLKRARTMANYPQNALAVSKQLVRTEERRQRLLAINKAELSTLVDQLVSDECINAVMQFAMSRMKRAKAKM